MFPLLHSSIEEFHGHSSAILSVWGEGGHRPVELGGDEVDCSLRAPFQMPDEGEICRVKNLEVILDC